MTMKTTDRLIKAFEKFNEDLKEFGEQTGEVFVTLYEDANTTREVANFKLYKNGKLTWVEMEDTWKDGRESMSQGMRNISTQMMVTSRTP